MTHVPNYPHADPRQNWVYTSSPIAASDSPLPLYMPTPTSHVNTPTPVNNTLTHINIVNTHTAPLNPNVPNVNNPTQPSQPPNPAQLAKLLYPSVNTVDTNPTAHPLPTHPATLYDLLSPKLLHQHSLLTAVQQLLQPITHLPSIPIETLTPRKT